MRMQTICFEDTLKYPTWQDDKSFINVAITDNNYASTALLKTKVSKTARKANHILRQENVIWSVIRLKILKFTEPQQTPLAASNTCPMLQTSIP